MIASIKDLEKTINSALGTSIKRSEIKLEQLFIEIDDEDLSSVILFLKTNNKCKFKQLIDITAIDYPNREKRFKVVYLLLSHEKNLRITISSNIDEKKSISSITKFSHPQIGWKEKFLICMAFLLMIILI